MDCLTKHRFPQLLSGLVFGLYFVTYKVLLTSCYLPRHPWCQEKSSSGAQDFSTTVYLSAHNQRRSICHSCPPKTISSSTSQPLSPITECFSNVAAKYIVTQLSSILFFLNLCLAEQNYDVVSRELLFIKLALEEWHHWLKGFRHPVQVLTTTTTLNTFKMPGGWTLNNTGGPYYLHTSSSPSPAPEYERGHSVSAKCSQWCQWCFWTHPSSVLYC